ncbi:MAG: tyrosine-type recombinase/integrase [Methyloprofundus sp.]|nr:tyrosine-type recombinase/integrase [Methyloprofundus sp.]
MENPVSLYLLTLGSKVSRTSTLNKLNMVAQNHGFKDAYEYPWEGVNYVTVLNVMADMESSKKSHSTINATLSAIKGVTKQCWMTNRLDGDTFSRIKNIKQKKSERLSTGQAVSHPDVEALFNTIGDSLKDVRDAAILTLGFGMGLRREEIAQLKLHQVKIKEQTVRVIGKGNKEREVPMDKRSFKLLNKWIDCIKKEKSLQKIEGEHLFGRINKAQRIENLKGIDNSTIWRVLKSVAKRSGVDFDTLPAPHDMRRTRITKWLDLSDVRTAQKLAGHNHVQTTMGYDRGDLTDKMRAVQDQD